MRMKLTNCPLPPLGIVIHALGALALWGGAMELNAQTANSVIRPTIAYQGRLSDGGALASGSYDFIFTLMDAETAGNAVGNPIQKTLQVQAGVFSTSLDFPPESFDAGARWLEVRVRPTPKSTGTTDGSTTQGSATSSSPAYTVLSRQVIQSVPYAYKAKSASTVETVPVGSLPASVPLIVQGKLDSALLGADIARSTEVAAVSAVNTTQDGEIATLKAADKARVTEVETLKKGLNDLSTSTAATLKSTQEAQQQQAAKLDVWTQTVSNANTAQDAEISALKAADKVRVAEVETLKQALSDLAASAATAQNLLQTLQQQQNAKLDALTQQNTTLNQTLQEALAPTRSGWMVASSDAADTALLQGGFTVVSSIPAPAWTSVSTVNAPTARFGSASVWTGQEWILWGGAVGGQKSVASGARYRPDLDVWTEITPADAPVARSGHTAVWTGSEMIVWGGYASGNPAGNGGKYNPTTQTWTPLSLTGAPSARGSHGAVWAGGKMIVWGGRNLSGLLSDGALYSPETDIWSALPSADAPEARQGASVLWTGTALVVWGGDGESGTLNTGSLLLLGRNGTPLGWKTMAVPQGLVGRVGHATVWDGTRMWVWGGRTRSGQLLSDGAYYTPAQDAWTLLPSAGAPTPRQDAVAVWTGEEYVVFGGADASGEVSTGAAIRPGGSSWRPLPTNGTPLARRGAQSAWTGSKLLVFGGQSGNAPVATPQSLEVRPPWYFYRRGASNP